MLAIHVLKKFETDLKLRRSTKLLTSPQNRVGGGLCVTSCRLSFKRTATREQSEVLRFAGFSSHLFHGMLEEEEPLNLTQQKSAVTGDGRRTQPAALSCAASGFEASAARGPTGGVAAVHHQLHRKKIKGALLLSTSSHFHSKSLFNRAMTSAAPQQTQRVCSPTKIS